MQNCPSDVTSMRQ